MLFSLNFVVWCSEFPLRLVRLFIVLHIEWEKLLNFHSGNYLWVDAANNFKTYHDR